MSIVDKTIDFTVKFALPVHKQFKSLYCKAAIGLYSQDRIRRLTLPMAYDLEHPELVELEDTRLIDVQPEIFYYMHKYDSMDSATFRETLRGWGFEPLDKYVLADTNGKLITLVTTEKQLYCY